MSQPVNTWKNGKPNVRKQSAFDISLIGIHLRSLPLPKAIHNLSISSLWNIEIAKTTTSVSVLITKDVFNPWTAECFTWTNILVSASSWLQGQRPHRSILLLQRTCSPCVTQTNLKGCKDAIRSARKENNSVLFSFVDWFCLFVWLWVLTFPLEDCSEFGNFVITLI